MKFCKLLLNGLSKIPIKKNQNEGMFTQIIFLMC